MLACKTSPGPTVGWGYEASHRYVCSLHRRPALFRYRDAVRSDKRHDLCFRCYRSFRDKIRAKTLIEAA